MSKLNILVNFITETKLKNWYNKHYKNWNDYYLSDEYTLDIIYIIGQFKHDILNGFKIALEQKRNDMENDEYIRDKFIILLDNYDNTFEYISKCFDDNIYYPNGFNINWIIDLFELKNDNITLK